MTRFEQRKKNRSRTRIEALDPCNKFSVNAGINPFAYLFQKMALAQMLAGRSKEQAEKATAHKIRVSADQKSAKARANRKRNKV